MNLWGRQPVVAALALALVTMSGCLSDDDQAGPPAPAPKPPAQVEPQPPLVPATMPTETVDQFGKLKLTLHRPERNPSDEGESAIRAWVTYTRAYYKGVATYVEDPELAKVTTDDELEDLRDEFADRKAEKTRVGGELEITIKARYADDGSSLAGCRDQSGLRIVHPDGTLHPDPQVVKEPAVDLLPDLTRESGQWRISRPGDQEISHHCLGGEWPS